METVETLIIGGGVIGASVAYHLAAKGCKNILVLDRNRKPGEGSTGKATGGFRCQFSTEVNIQLSLLSREKLLRCHDEIGFDPGYLQVGYLFVACNEREMNALRSSLILQQHCGVKDVLEVGPSEIQKINPEISIDGVIGGTFCASDGFILPMSILRGYMRAAQCLGVRFEFGIEVQQLTRSSTLPSRITQVKTSAGIFSVNSVVNAAGAWAGVVSRLAGVEIPVTPLRRQVTVVKEKNILPDTTPMTVFVEDGFHFRVREEQILLLLPTEHSSYHSFDVAVDAKWIEQVWSRARMRVPRLAACSIDRDLCWAGLYEMTPDKHAVVGKLPGIDNLFLVNGSSGHGVMHSPALGQVVAELMVDGAPTCLNIHALHPTRFAEGRLNAVSDVL